MTAAGVRLRGHTSQLGAPLGVAVLGDNHEVKSGFLNVLEHTKKGLREGDRTYTFDEAIKSLR